MNISHRGNTGNGTYFVTSCTYQKISLFQTDRMANLLMEVLEAYRPKGYLLHEFVIMPDHFHLLLTPLFTLEKALQFIKGDSPSERERRDMLVLSGKKFP